MPLFSRRSRDYPRNTDHGMERLSGPTVNDDYHNRNSGVVNDGYRGDRTSGPHLTDDHHSRGTGAGVSDYQNGVGRGSSYRDEKRSSFGKRGRGRRSSKSRSRSRRPTFDIHSGYYNRRPSFGQWLKFIWLDIITMAVMGAIGLGVYFADPAPSRSFPVTFIDGEIVYPEFAYPLRKEIIPIWAAALIAFFVPTVVFLFMQIRIKSFWDVNNAIVGLLYSLITAAVFQVFIKWLIGGLRPHFLAVCQPDVGDVVQGGNGFRSVMYQRDVCTGDRNQINDALESMPSGHSTAAWAGLLFLYYYLNAKLKVFSNHHPAMWKLVALYAPVLGAFLITGALTIDEFHNWYDCLAGAVIGSVMATSAYRMVYASVWDFRFNHIPLTRHTPFSYGAGPAGAGGFESTVFTHKAGWGYEEAIGGAPFDAAHGLRGQALGFNNATHNHDHTHGHGHNKGIATGTTAGTGTGLTGRRSHDIEHNSTNPVVTDPSTNPVHRHDGLHHTPTTASNPTNYNASTTIPHNTTNPNYNTNSAALATPHHNNNIHNYDNNNLDNRNSRHLDNNYDNRNSGVLGGTHNTNVNDGVVHDNNTHGQRGGILGGLLGGNRNNRDADVRDDYRGNDGYNNDRGFDDDGRRGRYQHTSRSLERKGIRDGRRSGEY